MAAGFNNKSRLYEHDGYAGTDDHVHRHSNKYIYNIQ